MPRIFASLLLLLLCSSVQGQIHIYTFSGELPDGASNHPQVADGESWTGVIGLEISTADINPDPEFGVYTGAVRFGSLTFSGGYESVADFSFGNAFILDNVGSSDSVRISGEEFTFQVNNEDLSTLVNDSLLDVGTRIDPFDDPARLEFFQLSLFDEFGSVEYLANQVNNVSLTVSAVPEPAASLVLMLGLGLGAARRNRHAAMR